jgi:hypothetical protein
MSYNSIKNGRTRNDEVKQHLLYFGLLISNDKFKIDI